MTSFNSINKKCMKMCNDSLVTSLNRRKLYKEMARDDFAKITNGEHEITDDLRFSLFV